MLSPLPRAVPRYGDGANLQPLPLLSPETGAYISQDSIRLEAGLPNLYAYVHDVNAWVNPLGLAKVFRSMSRAEYFDIKHNGGIVMEKWKVNGWRIAMMMPSHLNIG